jgi:hypothetical protein
MSLVNETLGSGTETRPRRLVFCPRRDLTKNDRDETKTFEKRYRDRDVETETILLASSGGATPGHDRSLDLVKMANDLVLTCM